MKYANSIKKGREPTSNKNRLPKVMSKNQLLKLASVADNPLLLVMVYLGIFMGLRIGEVVRLRWRDIDFDNLMILIRDGKNTKRYMSDYGKDRKVVIQKVYADFLIEWRRLNPNEEYVLPHKNFIDRAEQNSRHTLGMKKYCQDLLKDTLRTADLLEVDYYQRNGTPRYTFHTHTLRHVYGCNMVRMNVHIEQIRRQMGHSDITDTQIYFQMVPEDTREELDKCMSEHIKKIEGRTPQGVTNDLIRIQQEQIRILEGDLAELRARDRYGHLSQQTVRA